MYHAECQSRSGFGISLTELDNRRTTYDQYKRLVHKWHTVANVRRAACCPTVMLEASWLRDAAAWAPLPSRLFTPRFQGLTYTFHKDLS